MGLSETSFPRWRWKFRPRSMEDSSSVSLADDMVQTVAELILLLSEELGERLMSAGNASTEPPAFPWTASHFLLIPFEREPSELQGWNKEASVY